MARFDDLAEELLVKILTYLNQICSDDHNYVRIVDRGAPRFFLQANDFDAEGPHVRGYEAVLEYTKVCAQWQRTIEELDQQSLLEDLPKLKDRQNVGFGRNMNNFVNSILIKETLDALAGYGVKIENAKRLCLDQSDSESGAGIDDGSDGDESEVDLYESSSSEGQEISDGEGQMYGEDDETPSQENQVSSENEEEDDVEDENEDEA